MRMRLLVATLSLVVLAACSGGTTPNSSGDRTGNVACRAGSDGFARHRRADARPVVAAAAGAMP